MGNITGQQVEVSVNVMEKSVTYMANMLFQLAFKIAKERGLSPDYIVQRRDKLERGFFVWFAEQTLAELHIEVLAPDGLKALERWDMTFEYSSNPDMEVRKPPVEELADICKELRSLPPGAHYRIVVRLKPDASDVEGWHETEFKPFTAASEKAFSKWGYGNIGGKLMYRGGIW